jgi:hypothetical protein
VEDSRRGVLKKMLTLGAAVPLAGTLPRTWAAKAQAGLTSQQPAWA